MTVSKADRINSLLTTTGTCVSIYMPTQTAGPETRQNPIRFKNLLSQTQEKLIQTGWQKPEIADLLQPVLELDRNEFWQHQQQGLAIFIAPNLFQFYQLPESFPEQVIISTHFQLKPLIPRVLNDQQFFLLALSQNQVRFFQGSRYAIEEIQLPDSAPTSLAEALKYDDPEEQLQAHTANPNPAAGQSMIYHGQGVGTTDNKDQIRRFLQNVNRGLDVFLERGIMADERLPLVLAGVEYLVSMYQRVSQYSHLLEPAVMGNPEHTPIEELHQQAWEIVMDYFEQEQHQTLTRYHELIGSQAVGTSADLEEIVKAAYYGRVDSLFIASGEKHLGQFDPKTNQVTTQEQSQSQGQDLLNFATIHTLLNSGRVYVHELAEMPDHRQAVAILRY